MLAVAFVGGIGVGVMLCRDGWIDAAVFAAIGLGIKIRHWLGLPCFPPS